MTAGPPGEAIAAREHVVQVADCFRLVTLGELATSPDGSLVAYLTTRWEDGRDTQVHELFLAGVRDGRSRRLDVPDAGLSRLRWSADSRAVWCLSAGGTAGPSAEIWSADAATGTARAIVRETRPVRAFDVAADGRLYYSVEEPQPDRDAWSPLREEFPDLQCSPGTRSVGRVWCFDPATGDAQPCLAPGRFVWDLAVSPSGEWIALVAGPDGRMSTYEGASRVELYSLASPGEVLVPDERWRRDAPSPFGWIAGPAWSSDSRKLAFHVEYDGFPNEILVAHLSSPTSAAVTRIRRPDGVSSEGQLCWWSGTHDLVFLGASSARARSIRVAAVSTQGQGDFRELTPGDVVIERHSPAVAEPLLLIARPTRTSPADLYVVDEPPGVGRVLTDLNPAVRSWRLPSLDLVRWTSEDGTGVEGLLELPPDGVARRPLPLVVLLHGGPNYCSKLAFRFWHFGRVAFAAEGWALFEPNYRGSTGYGDAFVTDLIGNRGRLDVQDVLTGIDALVDRGIADPERIAVMGWSYGGYLVNCLIAGSDRFRAASTGAGAIDRVVEWCTMDTPGFEVNFSGGHPWEAAGAMDAASPLRRLGRVRTPTLIHTGSGDERVPPHNGRALHRALHDCLGVPSQLVVYPGASHRLMRRSHRAAKMAWDHAWFRAHVLETPPHPGD